MRSIAIVGAGQAGLQLALGLLEAGHAVTLITDRSADAIKAGRVMSSQCMFHGALQIERDHGLNSWEDETPPLTGMAVTIGDGGTGGDGGAAIRWAVEMDHAAGSTDQRLKMSGWLDLFAARGGNVVIAKADLDTLETLTTANDLVVVAAGKGEIGAIFARDDALSPFDKPMRNLAMIYVRGMKPRSDFRAVSINIAPGIGEYVTFPALTTSGPCTIMTIEAVPGSPLDGWGGLTPEQHLARVQEMVARFFPWEAERLGELSITDANCAIAGRFAPVVRKPIATLPSGAHVLGLADCICTNDPIAGQGSNNASHAAEIFLRRIIDHGDRPLDADWMAGTHDRYWRHGKGATDLSNALLLPPTAQMIDIFTAAQDDPRIARAVARGFDVPEDFAPVLADPGKAAEFLAAFE